MATPRVLVLRAPGTNCDRETAFAFELAGATADVLHINRLLEDSALSGRYQVLCIPGGFSYGDDIAAGRILANQIRYHLEDAVREFEAREKLILGICNGFQVLLKSGILLPDQQGERPMATLAWNDSGRYEDRWVHLQVASDRCPFLSDLECLYLPVAHAEGKFVTRSAESLETLQKAGQVALRYTAPGDSSRNSTLPFPHNPNGSQDNIAGLCDSSGRVLGLMPHPERYVDRTHHPRWTRGEASQPGDGLGLFRNAVQYFQA